MKTAVATPILAVLLLWLAGCTGRPEGIEPVTSFDVHRYAGTWYEIMRLDHRFERGLTNVTARYELRADGTVGVLNRGFNRDKCSWAEADGTARFQADPTIASLSVTFFWPFAGGYHVFELDRETYGYAVVAGPTRDYLWILARRPDLAANIRTDLMARAGARGFPVADLILVDHSEPACRTGEAR